MASYSINKKQKNSRRRMVLLIVALVLLLTAITVGVLEMTGKISLFGNKDETPTIPQGGVNLNPPTEQEKKAGDEQKQAATKQQEQPSNPAATVPNAQPGSKKAVKPVIVRSGGGEVSGFVPGIVENGGTCTATFTSGTNKVTKTSAGFANASNTTCAPITYVGSGVQAGWSVTLTYSSSASEGVSDASQVQ